MIDLKQFCEPDDWRVCEPWRVGAHVYATNKKMIIRVAAEDYMSALRRIFLLPYLSVIETLTWNHATLRDWQEIPGDLPAPIVTECAICKGIGQHTCECGSYHECEKCDGRGETERIVKVEIGNAAFDPALLKKIATLSMARIHKAESEKDPTPFCFTGGLGYVMPMKKEEANRQ